MIIKDEKGLYTLHVDTSRNVVREANVGFWQKEDFQRFQKDYETKVAPLFKGKKWAKYSDLRTYKTSDIGNEIAAHLVWAKNNGFTCAAMMVESAIIKRQMNNSAPDPDIVLMAFTDEKEADEWLKAQGF